MPSTEIDEIFASKSKPSRVEIVSSKHKGKAKATLGSSEEAGSSGIKRKKKKKSKSTEGDINEASEPSLPGTVISVKRKRAEPETIIDPSVPAPTAKRTKPARAVGADDKPNTSRTAKRTTTDNEDVGRFRDSRGTGPRRKTEEGFSIYKEDELGIGDKGGDTPLCPFDCDCCF